MADSFLDQHAQKQEKLIKHLGLYAKKLFNQEQINAELDFLSSIYTDEFRHDYSDFFKLIANIFKEPNNSFEFLQNNLESIKSAAHSSQNTPEPVRKSILKLCDHINLEIVRYLSNLATFKKLEKEANDAKKQLKESQNLFAEVKNELKESQNQLNEAKQKISHVQGQSISIISIFLAFTLAFTGGLSYISSAIASLSTAPIERIITVVILCGLIIFNTMYVLIKLVSRLIGKNNTIDTTSKNRAINFIKKYKLFLIVNLILISFIIYPFIMCFN